MCGRGREGETEGGSARKKVEEIHSDDSNLFILRADGRALIVVVHHQDLTRSPRELPSEKTGRTLRHPRSQLSLDRRLGLLWPPPPPRQHCMDS